MVRVLLEKCGRAVATRHRVANLVDGRIERLVLAAQLRPERAAAGGADRNSDRGHQLARPGPGLGPDAHRLRVPHCSVSVPPGSHGSVLNNRRITLTIP